MWGLRTLLAPNGFQKREEKSYYILLYWEESCKSHLRQKKNRLYMWFSEFELSKKKNLGLACIQFTIYFESRLTCTIFAQLHKQFMNSLAMKASIWVWLDSNIFENFFSLTSWSRFPDGFFIYLFSSIYCAIKILVNHNKLCLTVQTYIVQIEYTLGTNK